MVVRLAIGAVTQFNRNSVMRSLVDAFEKLVKEDGPALNLIFISGDLAHHSEAGAYDVKDSIG